MKIFLTHIAEEAGLAAVLKGWIERTFPDDCEVFVSSDTENIQLGDKWLNQIDQALDDARLFLVLCSPRSVHRPWVNFETGCGWTKGVPVIPICHSGQTKAELPLPLSALQGIEISESDFAEKLLKRIAERCPIAKMPSTDFVQMMKEIRDAEQATITTSEPPATPATANSTTAVRELELKLLELLVDSENTLDNLAGMLGKNRSLVEFHLGELEHKDLIYVARNMYDDVPTLYRLAQEGRRVLFESGLLE